jgi:hypothetical protein
MPQSVTVAPKKPTAIATSKTARPKKLESKVAQDKAAARVQSAASEPTKHKLVVPTQSSTFPLKEISDLLDHLPIQACVKLTRWFLTPVSSVPTGAARPRAVLKTVIIFVAEYGSTC